MRSERGQALLLMLGIVAAALVGTLVLVAFGQALGGKSRHQRAADLAAVSAAHRMSDDYFRLFEPLTLPNGLPNPHHLSTLEYLARARSADATNLGAGVLAAWAAGWFPTARDAAMAMTDTTESFLPRPRESAAYDQLYREVYVGIFPALRAAVDRLTALTETFGE